MSNIIRIFVLLATYSHHSENRWRGGNGCRSYLDICLPGLDLMLVSLNSSAITINHLSELTFNNL